MSRSWDREIDVATVAAAGIIVYALAVISHEGAHALTALAIGSHPTTLSSTGVRGGYVGVGDLGVVLIGLSGSAVNAMLALAAWAMFRRRARHGGTLALGLWLTFAVNAWTPTLHLVMSPAFGFGDWMDILVNLPNGGVLRVSAAITGLFIAGVLGKGTMLTLAQLVGNGPTARRIAKANTIVRAAWFAGGLVVTCAAWFSPLGWAAAVPVAIAGSWGATWPLLFAPRGVAEFPVPGGALRVDRSWPLVIAAGAAAVFVIGVLGPGVGL